MNSDIYKLPQAIDRVLPNGLRVIVQSLDPKLTDSTCVVFRTNGGSQYEDANKMGLHHFMEHLFFRNPELLEEHGTINQPFALAGGGAGASTDTDYVDFKAGWRPSMANDPEKLVKIFSHVILKPNFDEPWFGLERRIIFNEIAERHDDTFFIRLNKLKGPARLGNRFNNVAGSETTLNKITPDDMYKAHEMYYTADRCCIVAATSGDAESLYTYLEHNFSSLNPKSNNPKLIEHPDLNEIRLSDIRKKSTQFKQNIIDLMFYSPYSSPESLIANYAAFETIFNSAANYVRNTTGSVYSMDLYGTPLKDGHRLYCGTIKSSPFTTEDAVNGSLAFLTKMKKYLTYGTSDDAKFDKVYGDTFRDTFESKINGYKLNFKQPQTSTHSVVNGILDRITNGRSYTLEEMYEELGRVNFERTKREILKILDNFVGVHIIGPTSEKIISFSNMQKIMSIPKPGIKVSRQRQPKK